MTDERATPRATIANSVLELIGRTPLVRLGRIAPKGGAEVVAKLEGMNPGGSAKDRVAYRMVLTAEAEGRLGPGSTVIEGTSGNTGIGLAMVCAARGYRCVIVMPDSMSLERIYLVRRLGAEVVLTPAKEDLAGAVRKADELAAKTPGAFVPRQFENTNNPSVHAVTTAEELLEATGGRIDAFVAGVGTGGTITGVGRVLRERCPGARIIAVEPDASAVLSGERPGLHKIQGIGAGFVPKVLDRSVLHDVVRVRESEAFEAMKRLGALEGINAGISAGAAAHVALDIASRMQPGQRVVTVFPDTGERYLSLQHYFEF
ncbi:MAG: cysteine synthase A [Deltaproteobacteria bacterium]|nr:cysteine synthase A [Deltaproteobacteria bacterium]